MKRIILSLAAIVFLGSTIAAGTGAFFSDTETSEGNIFTAGSLDLKVDSVAHYNGLVCFDGKWHPENLVEWTGTALALKEGVDQDDVADAIATYNDPAQNPMLNPQMLAGSDCGGTWALADLGATHTFFDYSDLKPGDNGENTISLHVIDNDAWACAIITPTVNDDVSSTEPELETGDPEDTDSIFDGELAQKMNFKIWADTCDVNGAVPGDNIHQENCEPVLTSGSGPINQTAYPIVTPQVNAFGISGDPMTPNITRYLGIEWDIPTTVGNEIQTDKYMADIAFYVEQSRNNPNFECPVPEVIARPNTLRLENEIVVEDGPWQVIEDDIFVDLTWEGNGPTFDYTLIGKALASDTEYSLIYYADGWPGNNPGALIGTHTSNASGMINGAGTPDLGIDLPSLPDGNYAIGAKIWLVPSTDYDAGTKSMTAWNPSQYLFEGNVYINYEDTNN